METVEQVMTELKKKGDERTRKTFARHGAPSNMFGVKIADLKTIAKRIKGNQSLACQLYETGNADAMYLAGIVADGSQMSKQQLESWANDANWHMISEYTVPGVATENHHARELAMKWIKSKKELIASGGWCTYSGIVATRPDEELDLKEIEELLDHVVGNIHTAPNKVRCTMNAFVIAVGSYVKPLAKKAKEAAKKIGVVTADMGDTACQIPLATAYIQKVEAAGKIGKKRKTIKC
jgi:3-methyladenine DNA glycosylase AlkD